MSGPQRLTIASVVEGEGELTAQNDSRFFRKFSQDVNYLITGTRGN